MAHVNSLKMKSTGCRMGANTHRTTHRSLHTHTHTHTRMQKAASVLTEMCKCLSVCGGCAAVCGCLWWLTMQGYNHDTHPHTHTSYWKFFQQICIYKYQTIQAIINDSILVAAAFVFTNELAKSPLQRLKITLHINTIYIHISYIQLSLG